MIKKVKHNCFDVFFNNGWDSWVRMSLKGRQWVAIAGDRSLERGASILLGRKMK